MPRWWGGKCDAQWSYTRVCGYMPMLGFLWEAPVCLVGECREGNVSPGAPRRTTLGTEVCGISISVLWLAEGVD